MININDSFLDNLNNDSQNLIKIAESCNNNAVINRLINNLKEAIETKFDSDKPLIVTLVGGTGSGKSELFCKLIGKEGASPSSKEGQRNYTDRCYIYSPSKYIGNLLTEEWGDATYIESDKEGFVLVDEQTIDTIMKIFCDCDKFKFACFVATREGMNSNFLARKQRKTYMEWEPSLCTIKRKLLI